MATKPTKPLFTARFTLVNTRYYSADEIVKALRPGLEKAGYTIYQTPAVKGYTAKYTLAKEGPFEGDDSGAIYETMTIAGPDGKPVQVAMDVVNDAKGTRPILEQRKPMVTAFAWNLGPPAGATPQQLADLLWALRKSALYDKNRYLGIGWTPLVSTWESTPVKKAPYPDRPPIPAILLPKPPKPIPPKPVPPKPVPVPVPVPIPLPPPEPTPNLFSNWKLWAGLGILGAWVYFGDDG